MHAHLQKRDHRGFKSATKHPTIKDMAPILPQLGLVIFAVRRHVESFKFLYTLIKSARLNTLGNYLKFLRPLPMRSYHHLWVATMPVTLQPFLPTLTCSSPVLFPQQSKPGICC